jgi:hypothetical protein
MMNLAIWNESQALDIYLKRLQSLAHYGSLLGDRALLIEYDSLVDHAEDTLAGLTDALGLATPLTPNYKTHRMTGRVRGIGDPSGNIKIGQIVRTPKHEIVLGKDTLAIGEQAFRKYRNDLQISTAKAAIHAGISNEATSKSA